MNPTVTTTPPPTAAPACCDTDEQFFRLVVGLLPPEFLYGAGALLASYDDD